MIAKNKNHDEIVALIENQHNRNRNWTHSKALLIMLVLTMSNYLPSSSLSALINTERVVQTPIGIQRVDIDQTTNTKKVLRDMFLLQHIMRYI